MTDWELVVLYRYHSPNPAWLARLASLEEIPSETRGQLHDVKQAVVMSAADITPASAEPFMRRFRATKYFRLLLGTVGEPTITNIRLTELSDTLPPPFDQIEP